MDEQKFLLLLKQRTRGQEQAMQHMPFPHVFTFIVTWLSNHPWRYLIPLAFLISLLLYSIFGDAYVYGILWFFRRPLLSFPN